MDSKYEPLDNPSQLPDEYSTKPYDSARSSLSSILENIGSHPDASKEAEERATYLEGQNEASRKPRAGKRRLIIFASLLAAALCLFVATLVTSRTTFELDTTTTTAAPALILGKKIPTLEEMRKGAYQPERKSVSWIDPVPDSQQSLGDYIIDDSDKFLLSHWAKKDDKKLITQRVVQIEGHNRFIDSLWLNKQQNKAILCTDRKKNWRHSSFALYWVLDLDTGDIVPVNANNSSQLLSFAEWSPRGDRIAFVTDNNLFLRYVGGDSDGAVKQITFDGGEQIFYGRPDWVYEEEVFSGSTALWWSLNGEYLAFLKTNDTEVPEFPIPYFAQHGDDGEEAYPDLVKIKYPKPGYGNPIVNILFLDISTEEWYDVPVEDHPAADNLVTEVVWTDNSKAIVRLTNRESDILKISVVDAASRTGKIVRTSDETGADGGWFEVTHNTMFVPADASNGRPQEGYIDTIVVDGYNHLAYFSPLDAAVPKTILTRGKWEVVSAPSAFDQDRNIVYFIATEKSPVEKHLYSVNLDGSGFRPITDTTQDGHFKASFSTDTRYVLLSYEGPDIPWQKVLDMGSETPLESAEVIESNEALRNRLKEYALPRSVYSQIKVGTKNGQDIMANAVEIRPADFDPSRTYPVLFHVYGGPISQTVTKQFGLDFQRILPGVQDILVVIVDGRGTAFMGREFRAVVRDDLGNYEVQDQITAAKLWASKSYVDSDRIAIWGWSYGGFMTLKTLETDAGQTFRYGMAVAPVTNWRFYDSIYTERYMHTPQHNPDGYERSAVSNATALSQNERFLIMHGTGDDNVHFQNTLVLLDILDEAGIENYDVHVFPDSDHSIYFHNANTIVYDKLARWIADAFGQRFKTVY
jgi:dipeptidyl aminopeptidase